MNSTSKYQQTVLGLPCKWRIFSLDSFSWFKNTTFTPIYAKVEHLGSAHISKTVLSVSLISVKDATTQTFVQATDLRVILEPSFSTVAHLLSMCYHSTPTTHLTSVSVICVTTSARSPSSPAWTTAIALDAPPPFLVPSNLLSTLQPVFF